MTVRTSERGSSWSDIVCFSLLACWTVVASAQTEGPQVLNSLKPKTGRETKPNFAITLTPSNAKPIAAVTPGDEITLSVSVTLPAGYYIYGTDGNFGGRTRITLIETGLVPVDADWVPDRPAKKSFEPVFQQQLSKFHDHVIWKKKYRIEQDADLTQVSIAGELSGQYCSEGVNGDGQCVPIIPSHTFRVALTGDAHATDDAVVPSVRFEYEERPQRGKTNPALLRFKLEPPNASPGDTVTLSIAMELDERWHTFSLTQKGEGGVPTQIVLERIAGLKPLENSFFPDHSPECEQPEPNLLLEVHHDRVTWSREFEVLPGVADGAIGVSGLIVYQTCKTSCLPAREVPFSLGDISSAVAFSDRVPEADGTQVLPLKEDVSPDFAKPQDRGMMAFLLTAVGFGFISLLTPCVFPIVPITVSFFLKQSESQQSRPLLTALVFCGSIVATFTVLGVGISALFGAAKLNQIANNPWLNVAIGAVFVAFAFNMLGLFEIRIPSRLLSFTSNKESVGGYLGAVFMAITFTLTSFTCTFAFAGTLLIAAARGEYYWPIIGMIAFGTAFASPFFFLALVPSLLKKLPKSGGWMNSLKVVMGLIEIGAAVKFFSVADLVWNNVPVLFDFVFVMLAWLVLALCIAFYLLGIFRLAHDGPSQGISVFRFVLAMSFLGLSGYLGLGVLNHERGGAWIMDQIIAFAPPQFEKAPVGMERAAATDDGLPEPTIVHHGLRFAMDVDKAIAFASQKQQPMVFDFTGVNCVNCRLMEKKLVESHNLRLLQKFVLVQLYADAVPTIADAAERMRLLNRNRQLQTEWFEEVTLPAYAVVTPDGKTVLSSYFGLEQKEGEFASFLEQGWEKWQSVNAANERLEKP